MQTHPLSQLNILVVDDETDLQEILADELSRAGAQVAVASDAKQAMERAAKQDFDIVVSDFRMPGGDGLFLLQQLQGNLQKVPMFVLLTGFADLSEERAVELGAIAILEKPFSLPDIPVRLSALYGRFKANKNQARP